MTSFSSLPLPFKSLLIIPLFFGATLVVTGQEDFNIYDFNKGDGIPQGAAADNIREIDPMFFDGPNINGNLVMKLEDEQNPGDNFLRFYRLLYYGNNSSAEDRAELIFKPRFPVNEDWELIFVGANAGSNDTPTVRRMLGEIRLAPEGGPASDSYVQYGLQHPWLQFIDPVLQTPVLVQETVGGNTSDPERPTDPFTIASAFSTALTYKFKYTAADQMLTLTMGTANTLVSDTVHVQNTETFPEGRDIATLDLSQWPYTDPASDEFEFALVGEAENASIQKNFIGFYFVYEKGAKGVVDTGPVIVAETDELNAHNNFDPVTEESPAIQLDVLGNDTIDGLLDKDNQLYITGISETMDGESKMVLPSAGGGSIAVIQKEDMTVERYILYVPGFDYAGPDTFYYHISDQNLNSATGRVDLDVIGTVFLEQFASAFFDLLMRWLEQTPIGAEIADGLRRRKDRIIISIINDPNLFGDFSNSVSSAKVDDSSNLLNSSGFQTNNVGIGGAGEALKLYQAFQPGFATILTGNGGSQTITQSMVDQFNVVRDAIYDVADEELQGFIDTQSDRWNDMQDFVGMNFNQWAETLGMNPEELAI